MIVFLIDADNFSAPTWVDEACRLLESEHGTLAVKRAYGSTENLKGLSDTLRYWAVRPFINQPLSKNTTDLSLAVDAMELACQLPRPALLVIGSGDVDFVPLVIRLRERGIRVVCITERSKMAQDAVHAYDQVIYVGGDFNEQLSVETEPDANPVLPPPVRAVSPKTVTKAPASKKKAPKVTPAKNAATKQQAKKSPDTTNTTISVPQILTAVPNLKTGQWQPLAEVTKALHDHNLLAKNTTSTKLFKKFSSNFELFPEKQPNQVRHI